MRCFATATEILKKSELYGIRADLAEIEVEITNIITNIPFISTFSYSLFIIRSIKYSNLELVIFNSEGI